MGIVVRAHAFASVLASEFRDISIVERRMGRPNSADEEDGNVARIETIVSPVWIERVAKTFALEQANCAVPAKAL
jgi:hypothetical protein